MTERTQNGGGRLLAVGIALLSLGCASAAALAHHGWSGYLDDDFALSGTVESARLGNPHGLVRVRAADGVWDVVLGPAVNQRRAGLTETEVPAGAKVTAFGHRHQDPERLEMKTERLRVGDRDFAIYPNRL
jgi:hypothetical protein